MLLYLQRGVSTGRRGRVTLQELRERGNQLDVPLLTALCSDPALLASTDSNPPNAAPAISLPTRAAETRGKSSVGTPAGFAASPGAAGAPRSKLYNFTASTAAAAAAAAAASANEASGPSSAVSQSFFPETPQLILNFDPSRHANLKKNLMSHHKKAGRRYSLSGVHTTNQIQAPHVVIGKGSRKVPAMTTHTHPDPLRAQLNSPPESVDFPPAKLKSKKPVTERL